MIILSIDGGGTKGILPATLLHYLCEDLGRSPSELFDIYAGTSTGAILCLGLAHGWSPFELSSLYQREAKTIFKEPFFDRLSGLDEHLKANYSATNLQKVLQRYFGDKTLADLHQDPAFGGKGKEVMICSFDLNPADEDEQICHYQPAVFHSSFKRDQPLTLVELAMRSVAAPTYFPVVDKKYIDGGVAINNPSMAAVAYAMNGSKATGSDQGQYLSNGYKGLQLDRRDIKVLSLGTGISGLNRIEPSQIGKGNWGNIQWIRYLPDLLIESNVQSSIYYVRHVLEDGHFMRINPSFKDPSLAGTILRERKMAMDTTDPSLLEALQLLGKTTFLKHRSALRAFFNS
jgi:patatin-like phospholipase/acyl hydrolase